MRNNYTNAKEVLRLLLRSSENNSHTSTWEFFNTSSIGHETVNFLYCSSCSLGLEGKLRQQYHCNTAVAAGMVFISNTCVVVLVVLGQQYHCNTVVAAGMVWISNPCVVVLPGFKRVASASIPWLTETLTDCRHCYAAPHNSSFTR